MGSREDPAEGTPDAGSAPKGGVRAVIHLGYPWWLLAAVLVVFALLLFHALHGRLSRWPLAGLALVLAPLCTLAAVAAAVTLSATLSPLYEAPARTRPAQTTERTTPATTLDTTVPRTPAPTASPSASPSSSTAAPSASPTASSPSP